VGFPRSAHTSSDRGGRPLDPGDDGGRPDWPRSPVRARRFSMTRPGTPPRPSIPARLRITRHHRGFTDVRPSDPPLAGGPGWISSALGFPPNFPPDSHGRRTSGQGRTHRARTRNQLYGISRTSNLAGLLDVCDLASHAWMRKRHVSPTSDRWVCPSRPLPRTRARQRGRRCARASGSGPRAGACAIRLQRSSGQRLSRLVLPQSNQARVFSLPPGCGPFAGEPEKLVAGSTQDLPR
jgi:hypothetical protein